ncbi:hypothetical protein SAMN05443246_1433 [Paenibacillus sp. GP183]|nr:hypothetical protein SAMN05443246_1433 [Paenibacillus sp. GP183]
MSFVQLSFKVLQAMEMLQKALQYSGIKWLVGGSCGLLLHGIELVQSPGDLDIYLDEHEVEALFHILQNWALDQPLLSTTEIYTSTLSHYRVADMQVEAVGGFSVHKNGSHYYAEAEYFLQQYALNVEIQGTVLAVMPLAHELLFNMLRDRPDRYKPIAAAMLIKPEQHLPVLQDLIERNQWSPEFMLRLDKLLGTTSHTMETRSRG